MIANLKLSGLLLNFKLVHGFLPVSTSDLKGFCRKHADKVIARIATSKIK
jgi:hypothetical protein